MALSVCVDIFAHWRETLEGYEFWFYLAFGDFDKIEIPTAKWHKDYYLHAYNNPQYLPQIIAELHRLNAPHHIIDYLNELSMWLDRQKEGSVLVESVVTYVLSLGDDQ